MSPVHSARCALALAAALLAVMPTPGLAQKKRPDTQAVVIPTFDGVKLSGTLYPNPAGKRDAVVLLLHHFDARKGGSCADRGWADLAAELVADGYVVLSFDFRGFGDSKEVDDRKFRGFPHNRSHVARKRPADQITHTSFGKSYYPYLVNDVAAVKAFLDRENDRKQLNSSNLILIGAGDGAAVGSLWLAHESRRRKLTPVNMPMRLGDPEVRNVTAAVWLSITPAIGPRAVNPVAWCEEAGLKNQVPMAFVHGQHDSAGENLAIKLLKAVKPGGAKMKAMPNARREVIAGTALRGSALLEKELDTVAFIKGYLPAALAQRAQLWAAKNHDASSYHYAEGDPPRAVKISKRAGDVACEVDVGLFLP